MKNLKMLLVIELIFSLNNHVFSQESDFLDLEQNEDEIHEINNYLRPPSGYFNLSNDKLEYYAKINRLLVGNKTRNQVSSMLVLPSFEPEYVINLEYNGDLFIISELKASEQIWYHKTPDKIKTKIKKKVISCDLGEALKQLHKQFVLNAKYSEKNIQGLDGELYIFRYYTINQELSGTIWSPSEESLTNQLIELTLEAIDSGERSECELVDDIYNLLILQSKT